MPNPRLLAVITALTCLVGGSGAFAAYTIDQLKVIEGLIVAKDCGALRQYLDSNPGLLEGSDPLAAELRNFAAGVDTGLIECLSLSPAEAARRDTVIVTTQQY